MNCMVADIVHHVFELSAASIYSRRLVHSDKANRDDGVENTVTTPAQAEKMPVFIDNDLVANMLDNMKDDMVGSEILAWFLQSVIRATNCCRFYIRRLIEVGSDAKEFF